jgi:hypothetical protein
MTCIHIYQDVGAEVCPRCGRDTHEVDWSISAKILRSHYAEGRDRDYICPQGGTIRGWWSI